MTLRREDKEVLLKLMRTLIKEEKRGQKFFSDAAKFVSRKSIVTLFEKLAVEEMRHADTLQAELANIEKEKVYAEVTAQGDKYAYSEEEIEYAGEKKPVYKFDFEPPDVEELPHFELFKAEDFRKLLESCSMGAVLKYAMRIEYDNFKYLMDVMKRVKTKKAKKIIFDLGEEEKQHFIWIRRIYDNLSTEERMLTCG